MKPSELVKYYSQPGFCEFMLDFSQNREVVPRFNNFFGKRPQTFKFEAELVRVIRKGVSSFHFSEELWSNPMSLSPDFGKKELDSLRIGWDLIFDIDTKVFDYAKLCAKLILDALDFHEIKHPSIKFSGGTGFHIGVRFEQPTHLKGRLVKDLYPEAPRIIGLYVQAMIKDYLRDMMLEHDSLEKISERAGIELTKDFNPLKIVNIDPVAISSRHLIRAPYSLNEKQWLVSVPLEPDKVLEFTRSEAEPDNVSFDLGFLNQSCDASELFTQAFDWHEREEKKKVVKQKRVASIPKNAVTVNKFPPCIHNILKGLPDGRKRALFVLINFYHKCGYSWGSINDLLFKWNEKNNPPLRSNYIKSQLDWAQKQGGLMPQNCTNPNYKDIGVCHPDNLCKKIKNPVTYALHKHRMMKRKT